MRLVHFGVFIHDKHTFMSRQNISFTKPNDDWEKIQVERQEYSNKLVNDLISNHQIEIDWIKAKLDKAEKSGFTNDTKEEILKQSKL